MPAYGQVPVKAPEGRPESAASAEPLSGRINSMPGPLTGFRVLELARILAGPWAGQILADLGADVVKVERKGAGDDTRAWGPPFVPAADGGHLDSAYFHGTNRGKRSIELDFESADGEPTRAGVPVADLFTGVYSVVGILAAVAEREKTGRGTLVDTALIDSQVGVLANQALNFMVSGNVPKRQGNSHP